MINRRFAGGFLTAVMCFLFLGAITTIDFPDRIKRPQFIDIRTFGAKCDGSTDDTTAIQAAMDSVPSNNSGYTTGTAGISNVVWIPAGVCVVGGGKGSNPALVYRRNGLMLRGAGSSRTANGAVSFASILKASNTSFTGPILRMDPYDVYLSTGLVSPYISGSAIEGITFDATTQTTQTGYTLDMRSVSNAPKFSDISISGSLYGGISITPSVINDAAFSAVINPYPSEGITMENIYLYTGYASLGGGSCLGSGLTTHPAFLLQGANQIHVYGGKIFQCNQGSAAGTNSDIAGVEISPFDYDKASDSVDFNGMSVVRYAVAFRARGYDSTHYGLPHGGCSTPAACTNGSPYHMTGRGYHFFNNTVEIYNRALVVNDDSFSASLFNSSDGIMWDRSNQVFTVFGSNNAIADVDYTNCCEFSSTQAAAIEGSIIKLRSNTAGIYSRVYYDASSAHALGWTSSGSGNLVEVISNFVAFANLPSPVPSPAARIWCYDCRAQSIPCTTVGGGTGAFAIATNSQWQCQ